MTYNIRTAGKALMIKDHQVLLIEHKRAKTYYTLPGGGQHHNEALSDTVKRECLEELGASVLVNGLAFVFEYIADHHEDTIQAKGFHQLDLVFDCQLASHKPFEQAGEMDKTQVGYRWVPVEELMGIVLYPMALRERIIMYANQKHDGLYLGEMA